MSDMHDWTPEQVDRLLAWVTVDPPFWYRPTEWLLVRIPGCSGLADRLFRWWTGRAVSIFRDRA